MNIETLRYAIELAKMLEASDPMAPEPVPANGDFVIVRSRDSGVHAGYLQTISGRHVTLTNSRRLWYWVAAKEHTLSAVSLYGITGASKITACVDRIEILDACEIIYATTTAEKSIIGAPAYAPS